MIQVPSAIAGCNKPMQLLDAESGLGRVGINISPTFWENLPDLVTAGARGTTSILQQVQRPSLIPGTDIIYNPATRSTNTETGQTLQSAGQGVAWGMTPMVLLAGLGVVVLLLMKK